MLHKEFLCCHEKCAGIICLTPAQEAKYRRTHEDFRCPMGHVQGFYGPNEQEKKIAKLEQQLSFYKDLANYKQGVIIEQRQELRSRSARIGALRRKLRRTYLAHGGGAPSHGGDRGTA